MIKEMKIHNLYKLLLYIYTWILLQQKNEKYSSKFSIIIHVYVFWTELHNYVPYYVMLCSNQKFISIETKHFTDLFQKI